MITTAEELEVSSAEEFERLPEDGFWEVVNGRAILLPGNELDHQELVDELAKRLETALRRRGSGRRIATVNVDIPPASGEPFRTRVPDLVVYERRPSGKRFPPGHPPEIAIEVLATRRGNVERTEKLDDYARAGIGEYWIVDPFGRSVEIYRLRDGEYGPFEAAKDRIQSIAMAGLVVEVRGLFDPEPDSTSPARG